ncbi:MAG: SIMPL domain-containing protein [Rhodobiaceae bacterium]|nr:SIMPL domain-containing protein [Rhodobiaceae bacterium]MCC0056275.1 SIMPL domain-containing protein [Rhodobiaceae bacterium]
MVVLRTGLIALLSLFAVLAARGAMAQEAPHPQISLTGEASATASPDMAILTSGVVTQAKTAAEALDQNSDAMEKVIDAMKKAGVEDRDLQTSGFTVEPVYSGSNASSSGAPQAPKIEAYRVRNMLTVRVRDLGALGGILDKSVSLGSNQISGVAFDIENKDALLDKARKEAVADAMHRAEILSAAAGTRLGRVLSINENSSYQPPRPMMLREASMAAGKSVPMEAGELALSVTVSVTWELVQ